LAFSSWRPIKLCVSPVSHSDEALDMTFEMPEDILKATQCMNGFACLSEGWKPCGIVKGIIANKILALDMDDQMSARSCEYRVPFGGGTFCTCPTGVEAFKHWLSSTMKRKP
jgi:hypothetical protein